MFVIPPRLPASTFIAYVKSPIPIVVPVGAAATVKSELALTDLE